LSGALLPPLFPYTLSLLYGRFFFFLDRYLAKRHLKMDGPGPSRQSQLSLFVGLSFPWEGLRLVPVFWFSGEPTGLLPDSERVFFFQCNVFPGLSIFTPLHSQGYLVFLRTPPPYLTIPLDVVSNSGRRECVPLSPTPPHLDLV